MSGADQLYFAHCYECGWDSEPTICAWTPRGYGEELLPAMNAHYAQTHNSRGPYSFGRRPLSASDLALRTEVLSPTSENTGPVMGGEPVASASVKAAKTGGKIIDLMEELKNRWRNIPPNTREIRA